MPSRRRLRFFGISLRRQAVVWSVLLSYCAAIFGMPLPAPPLKDITKPFPCQHRACGCLNADQCWRGCCCFSAQERVAWAQEHGVEAPAELVAKAAEQAKEESPCCQEEEEGSCCRQSEGSKPKQPAAVKKPSCHQHTTAPTSPTKEKSPSTKKSTVWVLGMMARKCGGEATEWSNTPLALPSAAVFATWTFEWLLVGWLSPMHVLLDGIPTPPTVPPPR